MPPDCYRRVLAGDTEQLGRSVDAGPGRVPGQGNAVCPRNGQVFVNRQTAFQRYDAPRFQRYPDDRPCRAVGKSLPQTPRPRFGGGGYGYQVCAEIFGGKGVGRFGFQVFVDVDRFGFAGIDAPAVLQLHPEQVVARGDGGLSAAERDRVSG